MVSLLIFLSLSDISYIRQLEPLLLSLRLCLAGQKNLQVEQTCMELSGAVESREPSLM